MTTDPPPHADHPTPTPDPAAALALLPRRFLRPLLLASLRRLGRSYGYELSVAVRRLGVAVDLAGVYRELRTLEQRGAVCSVWERSESGPDRRVYELTDAGHAAAADAIGELEAIRDGLDAALHHVADPALRPS